jgi:S-methylmethionine-dependent homocysteine/selenocysteine methylase
LTAAPEAVLEVHRENIDAGADIITTNSYGIIRADLRKAGMEDRYGELNRIAGELARRAVEETSRHIKIAGSLPPLNGSYRPDRVLPFDQLAPQYQEQAALLAPYVDFFLCETMSHTTEARASAAGAASTGKPVVVSFTLHDEDPRRLRSGESLEDAIASIAEYSPVGVMVNCCLPERISDAMPIVVNSGYDLVGGYANAFTRVPADWLLDGTKDTDRALEMRRDLTPEKYAEFAENWIAAGATCIGGCCGTIAAHTAALRRLVGRRQ